MIFPWLYYWWSNLEISAIDIISLYWIGSNYLIFFFSFCFLVKNCIKCVLLQFSVKRLLWNRLVISVTSELILFLNSSRLVFDITMVVSSANSIGLANLLMLKERSFICISETLVLQSILKFVLYETAVAGFVIPNALKVLWFVQRSRTTNPVTQRQFLKNLNAKQTMYF